MGYTHYWSFVKTKKESKKNEASYQKAIRACNKIIQGYNKAVKEQDPKHYARLSGYSAYTSDYGGLQVNGAGDYSHEEFLMREHFNQNGSDFCKTANKPYDVVVVACLIVLKHYLGNAFNVSSDGQRPDWVDGLDLATKYTKIKTLKIPASIQSRLSIVS